MSDKMSNNNRVVPAEILNLPSEEDAPNVGATPDEQDKVEERPVVPLEAQAE